MKKIVLLAFVLVLLSTAVFVGFMRPVVAEGTIYIRADGSVEGTDKIRRYGNIYIFTDNIYDSIVVERDYIVVDGAGYTLQGTGIKPGRMDAGITLEGRSNVTIKNMKIKGFGDGISVHESSNNSISGNIITNNAYGIALFGAVALSICGNIIKANVDHGIYLCHSSKNIISGNNIANNGFGIFFVEGPNNKFYHNNFINNTIQVSDWCWTEPWDEEPESINVWDDGYPSGGNYWSDYTGVDSYSGPYQNETDCDGIGDTAYLVDARYVSPSYNRDYYPLMNPWTPEEEEEKAPFWTQWWFWAIVIAVIASLAVDVYFLKKRKPLTPTAPQLPTEGTPQNIHHAYSCHSHP